MRQSLLQLRQIPLDPGPYGLQTGTPRELPLGEFPNGCDAIEHVLNELVVGRCG